MSISSKELRSRFLTFFNNKQHQIVKSAPLLPIDDPTLLFINAGMAQFKDVFTGLEKRSYNKACSSQKCVRAGGKHNDLENVGQTARHHVFFEMLGNFSFGDYFKKEACLYAWEFLTQELQLDPKKLTITVFGGEDDLPADEEVESIWRDVVGVDASKISRKGAADNFWAMGDTGPCGPCSEIHYSRGNKKAAFGDDDDIEMEVWNLVFMQYERKKDNSLIPLLAPCVDTGMGLERLCTVVNNLASNYDTDLLHPYIDYCSKLCQKTYKSSNSPDDISLRVIADHCRAVSFIIADGILPANEGRGYVLRRIMRRAIRHGARLGFNELFFHKVCALVVKNMGEFYPELYETLSLIEKVALQEEEVFRKTLDRGLQLFGEKSAMLKPGDELDGTIGFRLYETYGFPPDLTSVLAGERELKIDWPKFDQAKLAHKRASSGELGLKGIDNIFKELSEHLGPTLFVGDQKNAEHGKIVGLLQNNKKVECLKNVETGIILLDQSSFYGESGGQVGDSGKLSNDLCYVKVTDTKKVLDLHLHYGKIEKGEIKIGDKLFGEIDINRHQQIQRHHSVTHLLHAALRKVLGSHVTQKGSLVDKNRTRFDFSHFEPLKPEEIIHVEDLVNNWILKSTNSAIRYMSFDDAKEHGAMALFGEKYGDKVRVVSMGPHSTELCSGTHVDNTSSIGQFKIVSEGPLAAGIRRIEAVAGTSALQKTRVENQILNTLAKLLLTPPNKATSKLESILEELKSLKRKLNGYEAKNATNKAQIAAKDAKIIAGVKVFVEKMSPDSEINTMRNYADQLRNILGSGVVVLGAVLNGKAVILVGLTKNLTKKLHAGKIVSNLADIVGGKGGGRPALAQAGGPNTNKLDDALKAVDNIISQMTS